MMKFFKIGLLFLAGPDLTGKSGLVLIFWRELMAIFGDQKMAVAEAERSDLTGVF